jgi:hypothetical protein
MMPHGKIFDPGRRKLSDPGEKVSDLRLKFLTEISVFKKHNVFITALVKK